MCDFMLNVYFILVRLIIYTKFNDLSTKAYLLLFRLYWID